MLGVSVNVCLFVVVVLHKRPSALFSQNEHCAMKIRSRASRISSRTSNYAGAKVSANMRLQFKIRSLAVAFIAVLALIPAPASAQIAPIGARATVITIPGVPNAGSVTGTLFRGAQPTSDAFSSLQKLGVNIVVDLRGEGGEVGTEKNSVESHGMRFVSLPWNGASVPSREELLTFFTLLRDNPDQKVFIHCEYGADRTGVMIALYRIAVDHWTPQQAISEMKDFHYHSFTLPHLARYVRAFPAALAADPSLAGAAPGARPSTPVSKGANN
jgi:tyrosine-protein phosphatase SIW14